MQIKKKKEKVGPYVYFYTEWFFIACFSSVKSWGEGKKEKETYQDCQ